MNNPNAWVDPMGLMGVNNKGSKWWLMSDAEIKAQQNLNQVKALAQRPNVASGRHSALIANAKVQTGTTKSSNQAAQRQGNNFTPPRNTRPASAGLIGNLLPSHAAPFAKSQQLSRTLQMQGAMRNDNLGAVAAAGYGTFAVAGAIEGGAVVIPQAIQAGKAAIPYTIQASKSVVETGKAIIPYSVQAGRSAMEMGKTAWANPAYQASLKTAGGSMAVDGISQTYNMIECECIKWDGSRTAVAGTTGAVFGLWGGSDG